MIITVAVASTSMPVKEVAIFGDMSVFEACEKSLTKYLRDENREWGEDNHIHIILSFINEDPSESTMEADLDWRVYAECDNGYCDCIALLLDEDVYEACTPDLTKWVEDNNYDFLSESMVDLEEGEVLTLNKYF